MERPAFDKMLLQVVPGIQTVARRYCAECGLPEQWQDIAQTAFLKMLRFAELYDPEKGDLFPWGCTVVVNTIKNYLTNAATMRHEALAIIEQKAVSTYNPEQECQANFILAHLSEETRLYIEGYNYPEIANRCGVRSSATVMNRIDRNAQHLCRILGIEYRKGKRVKMPRKNFEYA